MKYLIVALLAVTAWLPAAAAVDSPAPADVLNNTLTRLSATIEGHRSEYEADPGKLRGVVEDLFLPNFDTQYAATLMLGRAGREATDAQKQRFITAFYWMLVHQYSLGLLQYKEDSVEILSQRPSSSKGRQTVRTRVRLDEGTVVPVDYRFRLTQDGWKVYDVVVEGISYVRSQRAVVAERIGQVGLVRFLEELEKKVDEVGGDNDAS